MPLTERTAACAHRHKPLNILRYLCPDTSGESIAHHECEDMRYDWFLIRLQKAIVAKHTKLRAHKRCPQKLRRNLRPPSSHYPPNAQLPHPGHEIWWRQHPQNLQTNPQGVLLILELCSLQVKRKCGCSVNSVILLVANTFSQNACLPLPISVVCALLQLFVNT